MRGPLGFLACAKLGKNVTKSASPIAFCRAVAQFAFCMRRARLLESCEKVGNISNSFQAKRLSGSPRKPTVASALLGVSNYYPVG
jgi:hypothetical protein